MDSGATKQANDARVALRRYSSHPPIRIACNLLIAFFLAISRRPATLHPIAIRFFSVFFRCYHSTQNISLRVGARVMFFNPGHLLAAAQNAPGIKHA
jgi:hypothetical protein